MMERVPQVLQTNLSHMTVEEMTNMRRSLIGLLRMLDVMLSQQGLTFEKKERRD